MTATSRGKKKRERQLVEELQRDHGFKFFELRARDERDGMFFSMSKGTARPAVGIRLMVPAASHLGGEIMKMRKRNDARAGLTPRMLRMLRDVQEHGDPYASCRGRSQFGGADGTCRALVRRKLLAYKHGRGVIITPAGRDVVRAPKR